MAIIDISKISFKIPCILNDLSGMLQHTEISFPFSSNMKYVGFGQDVNPIGEKNEVRNEVCS